MWQYFLTRLPEPVLPLHDSDVKSLIKMDSSIRSLTKWDIIPVYPVTRVFGKAANRMGTARRCTIARLFLTLQKHQSDLSPLVNSQPEGVQMLTWVSELINTSRIHLNSLIKTTDLIPHSRLVDHFATGIQNIQNIINKPFGDSLILPDDSIKELKLAGLL